ncbi:MAG: hypothetical protein ACR2GA_01525 [Chloroflexota bacterium]
MKIAYRFVPGLLAASLLAGGTTGVFAKQGKTATHRTFAYGQVSNLSATSFTVTSLPKKANPTAAPKIVQVALNATTKEKARKGTAGVLANGEYAFVSGAKSAAGITARRVVYSSTAFHAKRLIQRAKARLHRAHRAAGAVNVGATTATSLSITTARGKTLVFAITATTKYRVSKHLTTTAPTFTNGEKVRVRFLRDATTKSVTARTIIVVAA